MAGLALGLGGPLGRELEALDGVDLDGDPGLLAEDVGLPSELIVRGRDEMIVAEEAQLALLREGRRAAHECGGTDGGCSGEELPAGHPSHGISPLRCEASVVVRSVGLAVGMTSFRRSLAG